MPNTPNTRWPGTPDWDSDSYWLGVATTLAFMQADLDTEENANAGGSPVLQARLPYLESAQSEDLGRFGRAVASLNEECQVLFWSHVGTFHGEHTIELASTEGHQGLPVEWEGDTDAGNR